MPASALMRVHSRQSHYLCPTIDGVVCHDNNILQLVPVEVHSLEWQNWLPLQMQLTPWHSPNLCP